MNAKLDWEVINKYFCSNDKYISHHHISSYDEFLSSKLEYTVKTLNPFNILKTDESNVKKHEINVYMGGRNGNQIQISKPVTMIDKKHQPLYPNTARITNQTYASEISCDILIEYITYINESDGKVLETPLKEEKLIQNVSIGKLPVMLRSSGCLLHNKSFEQRNQLGECPYDQGGYFIVDGKEKVLVSQERIATNKLYLSNMNKSAKNNEEHGEYGWIGLIRNASLENSLFLKTVTFKVYGNKKIHKRNAIVLSIPNIKLENIPLFILFRALGVESDRDILQHIFLKNIENVDPEYISFIRKSVHEGSIVTTQIDALRYLAQFATYKEKDYVKYLLFTDLFPNMRTMKEKALYLGYNAFKMIKFSLAELEETNRDSYMYKRVDVSGVLIGNVFRDGYNQLRNNIKDRIDREYIYGNWKDMGEFHKNILMKKNRIFDANVITQLIRTSFKGKFGVVESEGIVQDLNRLSFIGYTSHVRRVNTPMDRSLKLTTPHRTDASQWGYMCPIESPDGENIGLLKHMAVTCEITREESTNSIQEELLKMGMVSLDKFNMFCSLDSCKIFLNNNWIGVHDDPLSVYKRLKYAKQTGDIHRHTSISWEVINNEMFVFTDAGRCVRPLYINDLKLQQKVKTMIKKTGGLESWSDFFKASTTGNNNDFDLKRSPIEYLDSFESNFAMIAMNRVDLDNNPNQIYEYLEIHPSLALSLYTNVIPLAHHNQAPRNIFSGQQGKQAVGVYSSAFNHRIDTAAYILHYPQKPLLTTKYAKYINIDKLPNGENAIVAIATYTGYNMEDSVIINKNSIARGMFNTSIYKAYLDNETSIPQSGIHIKIANPVELLKDGKNIDVQYAKWNKLDKNGLPIKERYIDEDDVLMGKVKITEEREVFDETTERIRVTESDTKGPNKKYKDVSNIALKSEGGMTEQVVSYENEDDLRTVKIKFRKTREPVLGDKFASRHGQKGVIGMILPQEDMPYTKDGIVPDLIVNPHAFPSRMTIAHLIESVLCKYACYSANYIDGTVFENLDKESYMTLLQKNGFQKHGNELMYNGYSGHQMNADIFIGPTFYYRLKHMVNDKMNYRGGSRLDPAKNPVTGTTRQPTQGRANEGGLRIGEMETNALVAHGLSDFLKESMMERSDKYRFTTSAIEINSSKLDRKTVHVETPYSFNLLKHEINALSIKPEFIVNTEHGFDEQSAIEHMYEDSSLPTDLSDDDNV